MQSALGVLPYLQLLHPVLTFGLLVRARFGFCAASAEASLAGDITVIVDATAPERPRSPPPTPVSGK